LISHTQLAKFTSHIDLEMRCALDELA